MSYRELYKLRQVSKQMFETKFTPVEKKGVSYKAGSNAILSLLACQQVRLPMLIPALDIDKAIEIMLLNLELNSFLLIDPVSQEKAESSELSRTLNHVVKM